MNPIDRRKFIYNSVGAAAAAALIPAGGFAEADKDVSSSAAVRIDYSGDSHEISPMIYSHFIEQLGMCIEGGLWTVDAKDPDYFLGGIRPDVLAAVQSIHPAAIRWPGGCFADSYHWINGVGPRENRRVMPNKVWGKYGKKVGPDVTNQFGTDEFLQFCEKIGALPMITANVGTAEGFEPADWVEYVNGPTSTKWGAMRAANGREKPYGVKYWFVGNEMWNPIEPGHRSAPEYAKLFMKHAVRMRERDPEIKLIASGFAQKSNEWNRDVLSGAGSEMDYLSIHAYHPADPLTFLGPGVLQAKYSYNSTLEGVGRFERILDRSWEAVEQYAPPGRDIKISFDEWNVWYHFWQAIRANFNLRDGLFVAAMLNGLMKRSDKVPIANIAQMINCIGIIFVDEKGVFLTPGAWVFNMYTENAGKKYLDVKTDAEVIGSGKSTFSALNVAATRDDGGGELTIFAVNMHRKQDISARISIDNFNCRPAAAAVVMADEDPFRYNTLERPEAVRPVKTKVELNLKNSETGKSFSYTFPAHSITALNLQKT